ncbi:arylesterase [Thalassotalea sp. G2M2-11]|uniref:arylesterase n=1 Tax=Thalassotalea sp. G2M2-11 TaxID=2787627 RepID=UPI0019D0F5B1|nr:arylesterase [Thalassotalea sp. G2M2-11]
MKKYPLIALILLSYLTLVTHSWASSSILLLGDSVSASYGMQENQGWVHLINQRLKQQNAPYKIVNASISGETTSGGLARLSGILSQGDYQHLIIELGGNDGLRGYSPKSIKNNLLQMIAIANQHQVPVSLMKIKITPNYGARYNQMFEQVFDELAQEENVNLLPFFMEKIALDNSLMQADGIHPNVKAQPIIADYVEQQLSQLMK